MKNSNPPLFSPNSLTNLCPSSVHHSLSQDSCKKRCKAGPVFLLPSTEMPLQILAWHPSFLERKPGYLMLTCGLHAQSKHPAKRSCTSFYFFWILLDLSTQIHLQVQHKLPLPQARGSSVHLTHNYIKDWCCQHIRSLHVSKNPFYTVLQDLKYFYHIKVKLSLFLYFYYGYFNVSEVFFL